MRARKLRYGWSRAGLAVAGALLLGGLSACDGGAEPDSELEAAQAEVAAGEQELEAAEAEFQERFEVFCDAGKTYIAALDRYGDVITQTTPTVGDVTELGADLDDPRDDAESGAEAAVEAHQSVFDAEQELAAAKAALAEVKKPGSAGSNPPTETAEPEPLVPSATVSRVERAEEEFSAVQEGISAETPLSQASQQYNAAVVALEMSWLRLFSDAGCLSDDQQQEAAAAVREYTSALQQSLRDAGYYAGEVDGVYGPETVDAVESLQETHDLPVTGTVDKATADALEGDLAAEGGATAQEAVVTTTAVQQTLKLAGFWDGPVDGQWTPELTEALKEFQVELGVKATGTVDAATIKALEKAIAEASSEPSAATTSPSPDTSEPDSSTPSTPSGPSAPSAPSTGASNG